MLNIEQGMMNEEVFFASLRGTKQTVIRITVFLKLYVIDYFVPRNDGYHPF